MTQGHCTSPLRQIAQEETFDRHGTAQTTIGFEISIRERLHHRSHHGIRRALELGQADRSATTARRSHNLEADTTQEYTVALCLRTGAGNYMKAWAPTKCKFFMWLILQIELRPLTYLPKDNGTTTLLVPCVGERWKPPCILCPNADFRDGFGASSRPGCANRLSSRWNGHMEIRRLNGGCAQRHPAKPPAPLRC
jgi:hypothetical protein